MATTAQSGGLFTEREIVRLKGEFSNPVPCSVEIDGSSVSDQMFLTSVKGEGASNVQVDRTFSGDMVLTAFGEKFTPMTISGLYISSLCSGALPEGNINLQEFYQQYRAGTNATAQEITVTYGDNVFRGVLVGLSLGTYSGLAYSGYSYSFTVYGNFT